MQPVEQTWQTADRIQSVVPRPRVARGDPLTASFDDWRRAALSLEALPESARHTPAARYVRAVAASRAHQPARALELLRENEGPSGLRREMEALQAECQLELGSYESAAVYYSSQRSPRSWLRGAHAWRQAGHSLQAQREIERVLKHAKSGSSLVREARALRAELAEQAGLVRQARQDYRWLAVELVPGAEAAYERLARKPLTKLERLRRAKKLAERGQLGAVLDELERLKQAPGTSPPAAAVRRCLARAHYRSGRDFRRAAHLFEELARLPGNRVSDGFAAAKAWSRAGRVDRAADLYREMARRYRGQAAEERARYSLARLNYRHGSWGEANRAYTHYLRRYARPRSARKARFEEASRYERAISRLAGGHAGAGLRDLEHLRRGGSDAYPTALLQHLQGVALASSHSSSERAQGVDRFEHVIRDYPLSFAALASSARLRQLGRQPPIWQGRPAPAPQAPRQPPPDIGLPADIGLLADLRLYSAAERALHAREPELLRRYGNRAGETLCAQYALLDRGFRRYAVGRRFLRADLLWQRPAPSNLWAWHCLLPRPFSSVAAELEARYALPSGLLHAVMRQESEFRPDAHSPAGAIGLMQLMPRTAEHAAGELGLPYSLERLEQPEYNLRLGAFYLAKLLKSFDGRVALALAGYNAGPHAVSRWLEGGRALDLDLWVARIPFRETRNYVERVMSNWARYRYLAHGGGAIPKLVLGAPAQVELAANSY